MDWSDLRILAAIAHHGSLAGAGRALVEAAVADARRRGARKLTLRVFAANAGARRLYEAAGFEVEVRESDLYIGVQDVVSTDPGAGGRAPRGSTVTINIV